MCLEFDDENSFLMRYVKAKRERERKKYESLFFVIFRPVFFARRSLSFSTSYSFSNIVLDQLVFQLFIISRTSSIHPLSARGFLSQMRGREEKTHDHLWKKGSEGQRSKKKGMFEKKKIIKNR